MGCLHVCLQIKLWEPVCVREAEGSVLLQGMGEGPAFPNKVCDFSGGIHQDSPRACDPLAGAGCCSQGNQEPVEWGLVSGSHTAHGVLCWVSTLQFPVRTRERASPVPRLTRIPRENAFQD